jgi:signal peptidase I
MKQFLQNAKVKFILDLVLNVILVVALAFFIRHFIVSPFHVYGPSMCSTINNIDNECADGYGDYIIVNELIYQDFFGFRISEPKAGDIIVFTPPTDTSQYYVKRIIGAPGDKIKIENGYVYKEFNGTFELLDESAYLNEDNLGRTYGQTGVSAVEFLVPSNSYFAMGDNRNRSTDSRQCYSGNFRELCNSDNENAFVPIDNIRGKASIVFYPFQNFGLLKSADYDF